MAADKRDRAKQQHEDAKVLKEDIEKRSGQIEVFLQEALSEEEFADYKYYVKMKSKLTIEKQELEDKISLGEEQISALKLSIPEKHWWSIGSPLWQSAIQCDINYSSTNSIYCRIKIVISLMADSILSIQQQWAQLESPKSIAGQ